MRLRMIQASKQGIRLWRNQVGRYQLKDGRWIVSGLAVGSSDLIGIESIRIEPCHVGNIIGRFVAEEIKVGRYPATKEQQAFIDTVNRMGGRGEIRRCV